MTPDINLDALTALAQRAQDWAEYGHPNDPHWDGARTLIKQVPALLSALTATSAELEQTRAQRDSLRDGLHSLLNTFRGGGANGTCVSVVHEEMVKRLAKLDAGEWSWVEERGDHRLIEVGIPAPTTAPQPDSPGHCGLCGSEDCPGVPGEGCMPGPFEIVEPPCHCPDAFLENGVPVPYCLRHGEAAGAGDGEQDTATCGSQYWGGLRQPGDRPILCTLPTHDGDDHAEPETGSFWSGDPHQWGSVAVSSVRPAASVQGAADGEAQA